MSPNEPAPRQHASTGPALPQLPEPSHAERVRTLLSLVSVATLSSLSRKQPGYPFGSLMPFALDSAGRPIFLISKMAMHTQNLIGDPRCSLFVAQPFDLYYVGGFGVMGWVDVREYEHAAPDPLANAASAILTHMNADHVDSMILLARSHAGIEATEATMTSVDRLGFSLKLKTNDWVKGSRINFLHEATTPQDTRALLVEMVRQAKARG